MQMPTDVVLRRTADLVPYANNARTDTPEQVKQIAAPERRAARAARGRGPLRAGRGRDRDRNVDAASLCRSQRSFGSGRDSVTVL